jgi:putative transposase
VDELANANLIRKPDGYYLKVTCYINRENFKVPKTNGKEIGLDFGIKTSITTSEGEKLDVLVEESDRLKKLQREMFRRAKGSNNRRKTVKLIQREYQKLTDQKEDKTNKIVSKLKAYSCICIQDEQISRWHKGLFGKQV